MREIKFRAWDTQAKKMLEQVTTWLHAMGLSVVLPFREFKYSPMKNWRKDDYGNYYSDDLSVIPMQYTGLKDKNGVEIYEGDVVRWESHYIGDRGNPDVFVKPVEWRGQMIFPGNLDGTEVIGNIYENPELLEQTNA